jgi:hypothetical protein
LLDRPVTVVARLTIGGYGSLIRALTASCLLRRPATWDDDKVSRARGRATASPSVSERDPGGGPHARCSSKAAVASAPASTLALRAPSGSVVSWRRPCCLRSVGRGLTRSGLETVLGCLYKARMGWALLGPSGTSSTSPPGETPGAPAMAGLQQQGDNAASGVTGHRVSPDVPSGGVARLDRVQQTLEIG